MCAFFEKLYFGMLQQLSWCKTNGTSLAFVYCIIFLNGLREELQINIDTFDNNSEFIDQ